jgi:GWxTD domain-containing protein
LRSRSIRTAAAVVLFALFAVSVAFAEDLPGMFRRAKEQFRLGSYAESLGILDRLQAESEKPGNESVRAALAPGLHFYRGACLAGLGRADEAVPELQQYLAYAPNATIDPGLYPPKVIAALDSARKATAAADKADKAEQQDQQEPAQTGSLAASYRAFPKDIPPTPLSMDESWSDGPVHYLMTSEERDAYTRLSDAVARSEFIADFWKRRDPHPETPENEFREEFERRVAFADQRMAQDETRGSLTDRGQVFVLLGPPTYVGRRPLRTGEDANDADGMVIYTSQDVQNALHGKSGSSAAIIWDKMTGPNNALPNSDGNYREIWHYRRESLPKGVSYLDVDFDFITRKGYGHNVLQRDDRTLATLETARSAMRKGVIPTRASK